MSLGFRLLLEERQGSPLVFQVHCYLVYMSVCPLGQPHNYALTLLPGVISA